MRILIADSGSTKTDWRALDGGKTVARAATQGINPYHQDETAISTIVNGEMVPQIGDFVPDAIYFYGSGCREERAHTVETPLRRAFPDSGVIEVRSDLLGAARALCGDNEGIACIMGTGANSCLYDGKEIVDNTPPLGYILGDEGSGAALGKMFLNALYKGRLPKAVEEEFAQKSRMTLDAVLGRVYGEPLANRFLASLSPFIHAHLDVAEIRDMARDNFRLHFRNNVSRYGRRDLRAGAVGSVAYYYADLLREAAKAEGYEMGGILRQPMDGLVAYHTKKCSF